MTAKKHSKLKTLRRCALVTSTLVCQSSAWCVAQSPVATLGIPAATSAGPATPAIPAVTLGPHQADTVATPSNGDNDFVGFPGLFLSALTSAEPSGEANHVPPSDTAQPGHPLHTSAPSPPPSPRRMSGTPSEPQLSPTKWVHSPLGANADDSGETDRALITPTLVESRTPTSMNVPPSPPLTEIRRAAMRQRAARPHESYAVAVDSEPIRPGYSIDALRKTAVELLTDAELKLEIRAYLSAEEKAKEALELIAQSIDTREQSSLATRDLGIALTAIREAEDFVGKYGMVDGPTITRMVRSHSTEVLKPYDTSTLNGLAAADVYLDWSRRCITSLAVADPLAAQAIRLLAQSHRLRDGGTPFGIATSVHLIRAAADAAPGDQQIQSDYQEMLQIAGLSKSTRPSGGVPPTAASSSVLVAHGSAAPHRSAANGDAMRPRTPQRDVEVVEVSPAQFAAISPATAGPHRVESFRPEPYRPDHVAATPPRSSGGSSSVPQASPNPHENDPSVRSRLSRAFDPITRHLR